MDNVFNLVIHNLMLITNVQKYVQKIKTSMLNMFAKNHATAINIIKLTNMVNYV